MDVQSLFYLSLDASTVSYFLPVIFLAFQIRRQPVEFNWLMGLMLLSFAVQVSGSILFQFKINPNYTGNLYQLIGPLLYSFFFYSVIRWRSLIAFLVIVNSLSLILVAYGVYKSGFAGMLPYSMTFHSFTVIILCIVFYYKLIKELPTLQLQKNAMFWVISGLFFSYAGRLAIYAVSTYLVEVMNDNMLVVWIMHNVVTITANIVIMFGAYINFRQHRLAKAQAS